MGELLAVCKTLPSRMLTMVCGFFAESTKGSTVAHLGSEEKYRVERLSNLCIMEINIMNKIYLPSFNTLNPQVSAPLSLQSTHGLSLPLDRKFIVVVAWSALINFFKGGRV